jgi:hypothetical protein
MASGLTRSGRSHVSNKTPPHPIMPQGLQTVSRELSLGTSRQRTKWGGQGFRIKAFDLTKKSCSLHHIFTSEWLSGLCQSQPFHNYEVLVKESKHGRREAFR